MHCDIPQSESADFPLGSHITTPRCGYLHHGIYVGGGNVVHYSGSTRGFYTGPVEEVPVDRFAAGRPIWVKVHTFIEFDPSEVIQRARSRVGENHYRIFSNNCEHFCEWCVHGEQRSYQVEACKAIPHRAMHAAIHLVGRLNLSLRRCKGRGWVRSESARRNGGLVTFLRLARKRAAIGAQGERQCQQS